MPDKEKSLGEFEQVVLLALIHLKDSAYGAAIRLLLSERISRDVAIGALYSTLERMEKKGLVTSKLGEASAVRGGRPKRFFTITAKGQQSLIKSRQAMNILWQDIESELI